MTLRRQIGHGQSPLHAAEYIGPTRVYPASVKSRG